MKALFAHTSNNAVAFYRVWQPAKYLSKAGVKITRLGDEEDWVGKGVQWLDEARHNHNLLFFQYRSTGSATAMIVMSRYVKDADGPFKYYRPLVIDVDDDMINIDPSHPNYPKIEVGKQMGRQLVKIPRDRVLEAKKQSMMLKERMEKELESGKVNPVIPFDVVEKDGEWYTTAPASDHIKVFLEQLRHSDCLIVSTQELKNVYSPFAERIEVIPNGIDFETFPANRPNDSDTVRIGLFGSNTHYNDWKEINDVIRQILKENPKVTLVTNTVGKALPDYMVDLVGNAQVEIHEPVSISGYHEWLADKRIDICVAPLADTKFNKSKSNIKYLEFGALGVPGVFSDEPPYQSVKHGETGFRASNAKDWFKYLNRLILDDPLRKRMGKEARNHVEKDFNMKVLADKYAKTLLDVEDRFKKRKFLKQADEFSKTLSGGVR